MPFFENEAAIGIVPYMHNGEAIPKRLAGMIPSRPHLLFFIPMKAEWIFSLQNTEMTEPSRIPSTQYLKI